MAIENTGSSAAIGVVLEISTADAYLSVDNRTEESDRKTSINPSAVVDSNTYEKDHPSFLSRSYSGDFTVIAAANTPAGHKATINLSMTDQYGNTWSDSFEITVEGIAASLKFHSISELYDDNYSNYARGNNDSTLNQGESAQFKLAIENTGSSAAIGVVLEISTADAYLSVDNRTEESDRKTSINPSAVVDSNTYEKDHPSFLSRSYSGDFTVIAAANTPAGHKATINLSMTDQYGNTWTDTFTVTVQSS